MTGDSPAEALRAWIAQPERQRSFAFELLGYEQFVENLTAICGAASWLENCQWIYQRAGPARNPQRSHHHQKFPAPFAFADRY